MDAQWTLTLCIFCCTYRKLGGGDFRLIYRHYATLYFVFCVDSSESELGILDLIQVRLLGHTLCNAHTGTQAEKFLPLSPLQTTTTTTTTTTMLSLVSKVVCTWKQYGNLYGIKYIGYFDIQPIFFLSNIYTLCKV